MRRQANPASSLRGLRIEARERMWTVEPLRDREAPFSGDGAGRVQGRWRGHPVIEYDGHWQGFHAAMARCEDRRLAVIVLTNLSLCRAQRIAHRGAGVVDAAVAPLERELADDHAAPTRRIGLLISETSGNLSGQAAYPDASGFGLSEVSARALRELSATGPVHSNRRGDRQRADAGMERVYRVETAAMVDDFTVR